MSSRFSLQKHIFQFVIDKYFIGRYSESMPIFCFFSNFSHQPQHLLMIPMWINHTYSYHAEFLFLSCLLQLLVIFLQFSSVQLLNHVQLFVTPWTVARQASLSITNSWAYSNSCPLCWWCHATISSSVIPFSSHLQSFPASGSFPKSVLHIRWSKYWSFSFSISSSNEYSGLISFRMDWLDLLAVQGTLKSLLQHHSSKASIIWCSAFFVVQLSHPYMTTGKTIALTGWTFVGKVMSLLFKMLSMLVIAFLPRSKCLLISWLQSSSAVILKPKNYY